MKLVEQLVYLAAQRFIKRDTAYNMFDSWYPYGSRSRTPQQKASVRTLRNLARTPIARSAINQIKDGVLALDWHFVSADGKEHEKEIELLTRIMKRPNQVNDFQSFIGQELDDMLVLDMGCFEKKKVRSEIQPLYLFPIDAQTIKILEDWDGNPKSPRYEQDVHGKQTYFTTEEVAVMTKNEFTHSWFGLSPTEQAWRHIQYLVDCQAYANDIASNAMPKYLVSLGEKAGEDELRKLRMYIANEVQGQSTLAIFGSKTLDSKQVSPIGDDAACLNWQKMLLQIISVCYRVPAERLGSAISNDRSTVADQEEDFVENTIKPWAQIIENAINHHVVELLGFGNKVRFEFIYLPTQAQKTVLKDTVASLVEKDVITFNEARRAVKGVLPIELPDLADGDMRMSQYKNSLNIKLAEAHGAASGLGDAQNHNNKEDKGGEGDGRKEDD